MYIQTEKIGVWSRLCTLKDLGTFVTYTKISRCLDLWQMTRKSSPLFSILLLMASTTVSMSGSAQQASADEHVTAPENQVKYPERASGPRHAAFGTIRDVTCSYPTVIQFRLVGPAKPVRVYNNNFAAINLTTVGFTPDGPVDPCHDFEGMKADIQYNESSDKKVSGQVFYMILRK